MIDLIYRPLFNLMLKKQLDTHPEIDMKSLKPAEMADFLSVTSVLYTNEVRGRILEQALDGMDFSISSLKRLQEKRPATR
jgi:hypothetical protein